MAFPSYAEAQAFVEGDGACIVAAHVQEGHLAAVADAAHDLGHQSGGVAFAQMIRVSADGTDLGVSGDFQALSRHGDQLSFVTNSDVVPEFMRACAEGAGLCERREFEHVGRVIVSELENLEVGSGRAGLAIFADHLGQGCTGNILPSGAVLVRLAEENPGRAMCAYQPGQSVVAFVVGFRKCTEQRDFADESARAVAAFGKVRLPRG